MKINFFCISNFLLKKKKELWLNLSFFKGDFLLKKRESFIDVFLWFVWFPFFFCAKNKKKKFFSSFIFMTFLLKKGLKRVLNFLKNTRNEFIQKEILSFQYFSFILSHRFVKSLFYSFLCDMQRMRKEKELTKNNQKNKTFKR